jgi:hypothetical protein
LTHQFITGFEFYIRNNPLKSGDPCTNNRTMKHLERLKKMVNWAHVNEWIDKNPFAAFRLRFKRHEMEFLDKDELAQIEGRDRRYAMDQDFPEKNGNPCERARPAAGRCHPRKIPVRRKC